MEERKMEERKMEERKMEERKMEERKMEERKMEERKSGTGMIFVSVNSQMGLFVEKFFNVTFSIVGTYYWTKYGGTERCICHLYDMMSGEKVFWTEFDEDLENLKRYDFIQKIYLISLNSNLNASYLMLRQYQPCLTTIDKFIQNLLITENISTDNLKYADVSLLYRNSIARYNNNDKFIEFIDKIGLIRRVYLLKFPLILFNSLENLPLSSNKIKSNIIFPNLFVWLEQQINRIQDIDKWFVDLRTKEGQSLLRILQNFRQLIINVQPQDSKLPILNINDFIDVYNSLCLYAQQPNYTLNCISETGSYGILGLLSKTEDEYPLKLRLKNGKSLIITTHHTDFTEFSLDELKEILSSIESFPSRNNFEPLRLRITEFLTQSF